MITGDGKEGKGMERGKGKKGRKIKRGGDLWSVYFCFRNVIYTRLSSTMPKKGIH
jgi:hypothetical protein